MYNVNSQLCVGRLPGQWTNRTVDPKIAWVCWSWHDMAQHYSKSGFNVSKVGLSLVMVQPVLPEQNQN